MNRLLVVPALALVAAGCACTDPGNGGAGGGSGTAMVAGTAIVFQPGSVGGPRAQLDAAMKKAVLAQLNRGHAAPRYGTAAAASKLSRAFAPAPRLLVPSSSAPLGVNEPARIRPGEVIVRFTEVIGAAEAARRLQISGRRFVHGGFASEHLHLARYTGLRGEALSEADTRELVALLGRRAGVKFTEANGIRHALAVPNDNLYPAMWHLPPINMPAAWDIEKGSVTSVTVAVVDTGIISHPDLNPRVQAGYDMISDITMANDGDGRDADPTDPGNDRPNGGSSWHGSHTAGTIGAATDNSTGVSGINWNARLVPVRVLGKGGGTDFDIAAGMNWAAGGTVPSAPTNANPASVVNMSLGGQGGPSQTYQDVIDDAATRNVIFVVAAGNDAIDASGFTPCNQTGVLCIGATRFSGKRSSYSNFGNRVDLMAPGGEVAEDENADGYPDGVLSTFKDDSNGSPAYSFQNGTSMAAPHIAGIVSLMKAKAPGLTFAQARNALVSTANPASQCNEGCGAGLVNVLKALQMVSGTAPSGPARLSLSSTELSFTPAQPQLQLQITNTGGQTLSVTLSIGGGQGSRVSFLGSNTATIAPGATAPVGLQADLSGLGAGSVTAATLTVSSNGGNATVGLKLRVPDTATRDAVIALVFQDNAGMWQVAQAATAPAPGFQWSMSVAAGTYFLFGAQDANGNGSFDDNEPIGLYPTIESPKVLALAAGTNLGGLNFTLSPQASLGDNQSSVIGLPCTSDAACTPGVCGTGYPGGYCTQDCSTTACPLGSRCVAGDTFAVCFASCPGPRTGRSDCRAGYVCENDGTGNGVCIPACTSDPDCAPATCNVGSGYCQ